VRSLTGDASDGIPSVYPGIGSVRAAKLVSAGLNPALPFNEQPVAVRYVHSGLQFKWPEVQRNYQIMSLIQDLTDERLTDKQRLKLKKQIHAVLTHRPVINYEEMLEFFGSYELAEALTNRKELYQLHA
jgi:5'-3' exonuclease